MVNIFSRDFWFGGKAKPAPIVFDAPRDPGPSATSEADRARRIHQAHLADAHSYAQTPKPRISPWQVPKPAPGVVPAGSPALAMDDAVAGAYQWAQTNGYGGLYGDESLAFMGFAYLAELTQRPEYRRASEIVAKEMTRRWIKITSTGDTDNTAKIAAIDAEFKRLQVRNRFREAAEQDGFFGRAQIYLDTGHTDNPGELQTPLTLRKSKVGIGGLKRLKVVEPIWTWPAQYDSTHPLRDDFYKPQSWYVMGQTVHATRLLTMVSRELPDILKPAYAFGGLSLSQMLKPYVDNWIRTRQSVSDLVHSFSVSGLATSMQSVLSDPGGLRGRIEMFNGARDNAGTMLIDKATEEFFNVSTPLGTLDKLLAQSQEQMSSVAGIPLVKYLGIVPSGLNATSEPEIVVWYDWVHAQQEHLFTAPLTHVLRLVQLSLFGVIDDAIGFHYEPLKQPDEVTQAAIRKTNADTASVLIADGTLSPGEDRKRVASEEGSPWAGLDVDDVPEPPVDPMDPSGTESDPAAHAESRSEQAAGDAANGVAGL